MIELTSGAVFLLSSMYGASNLSVNTVKVQPLTVNVLTSIPTVVQMKDKKMLEDYLKKNFIETPILLEIARCESTLTHYDRNGQVIRGRVNRADVGVMQINEKYHLEDSKEMGIDIYTVEGNVAYAKHLYSKSGSNPWSASEPCWGKTTVAMNR